MPPKIVVCSVCKEEVLKSKTLAIEEVIKGKVPKRACKTHVGVEFKSKKLQLEEKRERHQNIDRKQNKFNRQFSERNRIAFDTKPFCWICNKIGVMAQEKAACMAINMEKVNIRIEQGEKFSFFEMMKEADNYLSEEQRVALFKLRPNKVVINKIKNPGCKQAAEFADLVLICGDCAKFYCLPLPAPPKINLKDIALLGAIMQPELHALAKEELKEA